MEDFRLSTSSLARAPARVRATGTSAIYPHRRDDRSRGCSPRRCATDSASSSRWSSTIPSSSRRSSSERPECWTWVIDDDGAKRWRAARAARPASRPARCGGARLCPSAGRRTDHAVSWRGSAADPLGGGRSGLDSIDRKILPRSSTNSTAARSASKRSPPAIGEESDTIEDVYEPFLIQRVLQRTAAWPHGHGGLGYTAI